jgi:hypothetical protein
MFFFVSSFRRLYADARTYNDFCKDAYIRFSSVWLGDPIVTKPNTV